MTTAFAWTKKGFCRSTVNTYIRNGGVMQFSKEFIEQVRAGNPIVDVVGSYVPLTRKQNNYWACCPFHEEKTPSFSVSPDKEFFYCFGCHAGGDVFQFVQKIENISFPESVESWRNGSVWKFPKRIYRRPSASGKKSGNGYMRSAIWRPAIFITV